MRAAACLAIGRLAEMAFSKPNYGNPMSGMVDLAISVIERSSNFGIASPDVTRDAERLALQLRIGRPTGKLSYPDAAMNAALNATDAPEIRFAA